MRLSVGDSVRIAIVARSNGEFYEREGTITGRESGAFLVETNMGAKYRAWRNRPKYKVDSDAELVAGCIPKAIKQEAA